MPWSPRSLSVPLLCPEVPGCALLAAFVSAPIPYGPVLLSVPKVKLNVMGYCGCLLHKRLLERSYWQITFLFCDCSSIFLPPAKQKKKEENEKPTTLLDVSKYPFANTQYCIALSSWEPILM